MIEHLEPRVTGNLEIKLDTGSGGNTLPLRTFRQMFGKIPPGDILKPEPTISLTSYSGDNILCLGSLELNLSTKRHLPTLHKFFVVDVNGPAILGLKSCQSLQLVKIDVSSIDKTVPTNKQDISKTTNTQNCKINNLDDLVQLFPDCFDGVGNFQGEETLHLKPNAEPSVDPPRRCPINLKNAIKKELNTMEENGIIRKVDYHTDWCSSITYAIKKDGNLGICLDPRKLNDALKRCPHPTPTVEETNPSFCKAKYFTKLDAKAGYWSVKLSPDSQDITTFRSPFGRYCFRRLPFGLCVSQDIFQKHMDRIVEML